MRLRVFGRAEGRFTAPLRISTQHLTRFVSAALHSLPLPGVEIGIEQAPDLSLPEGQSARAGLALRREPLYARLRPSRHDPLVSALGALSAHRWKAIFQVTLAPDPRLAPTGGTPARCAVRLGTPEPARGRASAGWRGILLSAVSEIVKEIFSRLSALQEVPAVTTGQIVPRRHKSRRK